LAKRAGSAKFFRSLITVCAGFHNFAVGIRFLTLDTFPDLTPVRHNRADRNYFLTSVDSGEST
jgi:hypothetical protein